MENTNKENEELKEKVIFVLNYWFHIDEKDIDKLKELTEKDLKAITTYLFRLGTTGKLKEILSKDIKDITKELNNGVSTNDYINLDEDLEKIRKAIENQENINIKNNALITMLTKIYDDKARESENIIKAKDETIATQEERIKDKDKVIKTYESTLSTNEEEVDRLKQFSEKQKTYIEHLEFTLKDYIKNNQLKSEKKATKEIYDNSDTNRKSGWFNNIFRKGTREDNEKKKEENQINKHNELNKIQELKEEKEKEKVPDSGTKDKEETNENKLQKETEKKEKEEKEKEKKRRLRKFINECSKVYDVETLLFIEESLNKGIPISDFGLFLIQEKSLDEKKALRDLYLRKGLFNIEKGEEN